MCDQVADASGYGYSRGHGVPFTGHGVGLAMAKTYTQFMGGDLSLSSVPGHGTHAFLTFDRTGSRAALR